MLQDLEDLLMEVHVEQIRLQRLEQPRNRPVLLQQLNQPLKRQHQLTHQVLKVLRRLLVDLDVLHKLQRVVDQI